MKALLVTTPGHVSVADVEVPIPKDDEAMVAPKVCGMCGTDLELINGTIDPAYVRYPLVLGHEWAGKLLTPVNGVAEAGEHVVVEGIVFCGSCSQCLQGNTNRCINYDELGFTRSGAIAERIAVPARLVHRLEPNVNLEDASLIEPMAVVWHALTRQAPSSPSTVAVIGDGTVALLAVHLLRLLNPTSITVIGRREAQEELAIKAGANSFLTQIPDRQFNVVIEAAGTGEAVSAALSIVARGGTAVLLGLPPHGTQVQIAPDDLVNNDITLRGSFSYNHQAWTDVVQRVNAGDLTPSFLITHRYPLAQAMQAIATLSDNTTIAVPRGKVSIFPNN